MGADAGADTTRLDFPLVIEQVAFGGRGMGRLASGKVCFVPRVIAGETVLVRPGRDRASYAEAEPVRVMEPSPDRVDPPCPVFGRCGGCQYQHMAYGRQVAVKRDQVADVLRRLGGMTDPPVEPMLASPKEFHYRNRITVHVRGGRVGFFETGSRRVVEVEECPIASSEVNGLLTALRASRPRDGEYALREPGEFHGFRQVNDAMAEGLLASVEEMVAPGGGLLVDAYCGAGFFARRLRGMFRTVVGIEWSADTVRAARAGADANESYLLGDVRDHLAAAFEAGPAAETTLLLDPPSEGLDADVIAGILARLPARVVYVSCNPSTLARDCRRLASRYALRRARPVDMFPQTAEIEVVSLLELT